MSTTEPSPEEPTTEQPPAAVPGQEEVEPNQQGEPDDNVREALATPPEGGDAS